MTLQNINIKSGTIIYDAFNVDPNVPYENQLHNLNQDLLDINYPKDYSIAVAWLPDFNPNGNFIVYVIKDQDWINPVLTKETRSFERLKKYIQECIELVDLIINDKIPSNYLNQQITSLYENFDFDRSHFQNFFDEEKVTDVESGSFYYSKRLENGFECEVNILAIDNFIALTLRHNDDKVFSIGFENITKIALSESDDHCFFDLYKENTTKPYRSFLIKPRVSLDVLIK